MIGERKDRMIGERERERDDRRGRMMGRGGRYEREITTHQEEGERQSIKGA